MNIRVICNSKEDAVKLLNDGGVKISRGWPAKLPDGSGWELIFKIDTRKLENRAWLDKRFVVWASGTGILAR